MIVGKRLLMRGYGNVCNGCTFALCRPGARVFIAVCDPVYAVQACVGRFQTTVMESIVLESIGMTTSSFEASSWLSTVSAMTLVGNMICCGKVHNWITDENTRSQIFKGHVDFTVTTNVQNLFHRLRVNELAD